MLGKMLTKSHESKVETIQLESWNWIPQMNKWNYKVYGNEPKIENKTCAKFKYVINSRSQEDHS